MAKTTTLTIVQGDTFTFPVYWETSPIVYKPITAITNAAPVRITATGHGLVSGWYTAVVSVLGMTAINAQNSPPKDTDYHAATVVDINTITLNDVNSSSFKPYTSGGYLQYNTPMDMTGFTARMSIKKKTDSTNLLQCTTGGTSGTTAPTAAGTDGTVVWTSAVAGTPTFEWKPNTAYLTGAVIDTNELLRLTSTNSRITIDNTNKVVTLTISAADTAQITWKSALYDFEMVSPAGVVTKLLTGSVTVTQEVTTT